MRSNEGNLKSLESMAQIARTSDPYWAPAVGVTVVVERDLQLIVAAETGMISLSSRVTG